MKTRLLHTFFFAALLLAACVAFPRPTFAAAHVLQHAPLFGGALILAAVICKAAAEQWWATHIQLRGVGGKSSWQSKLAKRKET